MANVLLIDDSKTVVAGVKAFLSKSGFDVVVPERFVDIHRMIQQYDPAAIVLDINMPTLSGEQIGTFLRRNHYHGHIVIYSGEPEPRLKSVAAAIGARHYVSKDAPLSQLASLLEGLLPETV